MILENQVMQSKALSEKEKISLSITSEVLVALKRHLKA
jgi:DNA-binding IscR family transcriptional regulator